MITFGEFLAEIAVNPGAPEISHSPSSSRRSSKIMPDEGKFGIIPVQISGEMYDLFNRHLTPRYSLVAGLLDRRGDTDGNVVVKASNQEIESLKELAQEIINTSPGDKDIGTAYAAIRSIRDFTPT